MALTQKLQMRQSQALVMTPQLMQAIKLLQLSNLDLAAYVEGELERNPFLEHAGDGEQSPAERERTMDTVEPAEANGRDHDAQSADWINEDLETSRSTIEARLDTDLENVFPDDASHTSPQSKSDEQPSAYAEWGRTGGSREDGDYNLEAFVSAELTLADHLAEQLALAIPDPVRRMIGQYLIDLVDEAGYLGGDLAGVAEKLGAPLPKSRRCSPSCRPSIRPAFARAISPNASPSSSRSATASILRCRRWSAVSICSPSAISRRCGASAASATRTSPR